MRSGLQSPPAHTIVLGMQLPSEPVTLSVEQVDDLNRKLSAMRHDINNHLSLIMAATELIKHRPQMLERMINTLIEQPPKITASVAQFSAEFERVAGIKRNNTGGEKTSK